MADMNAIFDKLDKILSNVDLEDVTAESTGFSELPDGYYLCEVEKAELTESKTSHEPMIAFQFKIVHDGYSIVVADNGDTTISSLKHTQNRKIFFYFVIKDESSLRRFAADMLKFEGEIHGEPLLPKEAFMNSNTLLDCLEVLEGSRIYISASTTEKNGEKTQWKNLISWKRADALDLP